MSRKKRYQIGHKQKKKRRKKRQKLTSQSRNPDEYFFNGFWVGIK